MQVPISLLTYNIYLGHPYYILEGKHSLVQSIRLQSQIKHIKILNMKNIKSKSTNKIPEKFNLVNLNDILSFRLK